MSENRKYGRLPRRFDPRVPHYSAIRQMPGFQLPPLTEHADNAASLPPNLGSMNNDRLGCCTSSGLYHGIQVWTGDAQASMVTEPDALVLQAYEESAGYNPGDPATDRGADEQTVLSWALNTGLPVADGSRSRLSAFVELDPRNLTDVCEAICECGFVYIGFSVPRLLNENPGAVWGGEDLGPIEGGHCVILSGYSGLEDPIFDVISWGDRYKMTTAFWQKYVDEAYALASPLWIGATGRTPWGLDMATLEQLMQAIRES